MNVGSLCTPEKLQNLNLGGWGKDTESAAIKHKGLPFATRSSGCGLVRSCKVGWWLRGSHCLRHVSMKLGKEKKETAYSVMVIIFYSCILVEGGRRCEARSPPAARRSIWYLFCKLCEN